MIFVLATSCILGEETQITNVQPSSPCDFFVSGSFIYWQPIQSNMKLGVVSNSSDPSYLVNGYEAELNFGFKPGFKVGLGMDCNYDNWDTFAEYTWFRGTDRTQVDLNPSDGVVYLLPAFTIPSVVNPRYTFGSEKWRLNLNIIDWDLRKSCSVGATLFLRPFVGLRGAVIDQHVYVEYINTLFFSVSSPSTYVTQSSNSWGIGPRTGLSSEWRFGKGWKLRNTAEIDVLYSRYNLKSKQISTTPFGSTYYVKEDGAGYLRAHFDLELGLGWGTYF